MTNLNYKVYSNGKQVKTEEYLNSIRDFYSGRPEGKMFPGKDKIRFSFVSEGIVMINPDKDYAILTLNPRNEEWISDLEEIAKVNNQFELEAQK